VKNSSPAKDVTEKSVKASNYAKKIKEHNPAEETFLFLLKQVFKTQQINREEKLIPGRKFRSDFSIPELKISFEVDGLGHHGFNLKGLKSDREKDYLTFLQGYSTIRFFASEVMYEQPKVLKKLSNIKKELLIRKQ